MGKKNLIQIFLLILLIINNFFFFLIFTIKLIKLLKSSKKIEIKNPEKLNLMR